VPLGPCLALSRLAAPPLHLFNPQAGPFCNCSRLEGVSHRRGSGFAFHSFVRWLPPTTPSSPQRPRPGFVSLEAPSGAIALAFGRQSDSREISSIHRPNITMRTICVNAVIDLAGDMRLCFLFFGSAKSDGSSGHVAGLWLHWDRGPDLGSLTAMFDDNKKIGMGMLGLSFVFLGLGVVLFFDSALIAIGTCANMRDLTPSGPFWPSASCMDVFPHVQEMSFSWWAWSS
jgi:hypothetical protein